MFILEICKLYKRLHPSMPQSNTLLWTILTLAATHSCTNTSTVSSSKFFTPPQIHCFITQFLASSPQTTALSSLSHQSIFLHVKLDFGKPHSLIHHFLKFLFHFSIDQWHKIFKLGVHNVDSKA